MASLHGRFGSKLNGVAKSPPYGVTAFLQDFDILNVCLHN